MPRFIKGISYLVLAGYLASLVWYISDAWDVHQATQSSVTYAYFLNTKENLSALLFMTLGMFFWFIFGINRANPKEAKLGYILASAHLVTLVYKYFLGPLLWLHFAVMNEP